jgi:hypothetical protein
MILRKLNEDGVRRFREFLKEAREFSDRPVSVPEILLTLPQTSEEIDDGPELEELPFHFSGYDLARYLHGQFGRLDQSVVEGKDGLGDAGFWAAVALTYFDLLTPGYRSGSGIPKADNCYIPEIGTTMAGVRYFRHRVAGPYRLFRQYGELCQPLLLSPASEQSVLYVKITDSNFYTETRALIEAVNLLYFDAHNRRLIRDWKAKDKPGTFPRLLTLVDQLDLTYDLLALDGPALLECLPQEFDAWKERSRSYRPR